MGYKYRGWHVHPTYCNMFAIQYCFNTPLQIPSSASRILIACKAPSLFPRPLNFLSFRSADRPSWFPGRVKHKASLDLPPNGIWSFDSSVDPRVLHMHTKYFSALYILNYTLPLPCFLHYFESKVGYYSSIVGHVQHEMSNICWYTS